jgi:hypothetical protein
MRKPLGMGFVVGIVLASVLLGSGVALADRAASPSAVSSPRTWHFEGIHHGTEVMQLHTHRCPVLDHSLLESMTLTDGTVWRYQANYCGTIDPHGVWRGVGSFVVTTTNGSTLSGRLTSSAQLPSTGVPYELDINSGTGEFTGADGSCLLDNHLTPVAPDVQNQSGIFVCDFSN